MFVIRKLFPGVFDQLFLLVHKCVSLNKVLKISLCKPVRQRALAEEAGGSAGNSDNEFLHGEGGREKNQLLQIVPD